MATAPSRSTASIALEAALVVAGFTILTLALFGAVFSDMPGQVIDPPQRRLRADINLIMWILSWGHHALSSSNVDLYQANILHPAPSMLTGSEHMLGLLPIFSPVYAISNNPVLGIQVTYLLSFALSGAAMYALLRHWGCSVWGAAFGGFVFTVSPGRYDRAFMLQLISWQYLPLALIFLDRTLDRARWRDAAGLALFLGLQLLTSFYVAYISLSLLGTYLVVIMAGRWFTENQRSPMRGTLQAASGLAIAGITAGIFALPYLTRAASGEILDHSESGILAINSANTLRSYLDVPMLGSQPALRFGGTPFYLGILPFALALVAFLPGIKARASLSVRCGLIAGTVLCWLLAMGPTGRFEGLSLPPLYRWFTELVPGFSSMRSPTRFGFGVSFGVAALAGIGFSAALRRMKVSRTASAVALLAAAAITLWDFGVLARPYRATKIAIGPWVPKVYRRLAEIEPGPLLELPTGIEKGLGQLVRESEYTYYSTYHWNPILNGYTAYRPHWLRDVSALAQTLPNPKGLQALQRLTGLRYVVVHRHMLSEYDAIQWQSHPELRIIDEFGPDLLLEVRVPVAADLRQALLGTESSDTTLFGTSLTTLPESEREARVWFPAETPTTAPMRFPSNIPVAAENLSGVTWPGIAPGSDRAVHWAARWRDIDSGAEHTTLDVAPLAYDLGPGETIQTTISPVAPRDAGNYELTIGLVQDDRWFPATVVADSVSVGKFSRRRKPN